MPITIFSNIPALRAQEALRKNTQALTQTYERLSSGMRINRAKDDAAGLSIAERLRADAKMASVAIRNINDGLSLVSVYQSALGEITNILQRMSELANQSRNGTITPEQRSPLNAEFVALGSEINRIKSTTEFNDIKPFMSGTVWIQAMSKDQNGQIPIFLTEIDGLREVAELNISDPYSNQLEQISNAIEAVGISHADGSSRLEFAKNNITIMRENFSAAESQIRDADIAVESANLVRLQILQEASIAILAQANQQSQLALQLLSSIGKKKDE